MCGAHMCACVYLFVHECMHVYLCVQVCMCVEGIFSAGGGTESATVLCPWGT